MNAWTAAEEILASWLCTISSKSPGNWDLCKEVGLYGVPGVRALETQVKPGDQLLFWLGGKGFVAIGEVSDPPRRPTNRAEAPWPGGLYRFSWVVPFRLSEQPKKPVKFAFNGQKQVQTEFTKSMFLRSFITVTDASVEKVRAALVDANIGDDAEGKLERPK